MSKREYIYDKLRNAISLGELKPGERLIEKTLCEFFNVGRTPLREALSQLQIEGYLDFIPHKGLTVSKMSPAHVMEIYTVVAVLEGYATKIATKYLSEQDLKELKMIENDLRKTLNLNDQRKWIDKNIIFHEYLVKASRVTFLHTLIKSLRSRIRRYRLVSVAVTDSLNHYFRAHEEILELLSKKDGRKAGRAMQNHVLNSGKKLVDFMNQNPELWF